ETVKTYTAAMEAYHNADAVSAVMNLAKRSNKYIDETAPWVLAKEEGNKDRLKAVLYNLLEAIRVIGILLSPVTPDCSEKIKELIGTDEQSLSFGAVEDYKVGEAKPLFARIDTEKALAVIAEKHQNKQVQNTVKTDEITIDEFAKVELRAAKVIACEPIPKAKKLLKLTLDDGSGTPRTVASCIAQFYTPEDLTGKTVIVVANLKPATLCGVESNGMILASDSEDGVKVVFLDGVASGSKIR
ncbi:MAG: methionine--tRNA ligase subunit beta, partial [Clostridia bacterium]|nr:methionine--tRNA ligase subunit beta [Clostridia bacterium]